MLRRDSFMPPEDGLPPQEVRFTELRAEPWPDDPRRVRIHLEVTPFLERPNLEVILSRQTGQETDEETGGDTMEEVSSINIIESIDTRMTFTMHIRGPEAAGKYQLSGSLTYPEIGLVDQKTSLFEIVEP